MCAFCDISASLAVSIFGGVDVASSKLINVIFYGRKIFPGCIKFLLEAPPFFKANRPFCLCQISRHTRSATCIRVKIFTFCRYSQTVESPYKVVK